MHNKGEKIVRWCNESEVLASVGNACKRKLATLGIADQT